jgi:sugar lactone lactonase YvrE
MHDEKTSPRARFWRGLAPACLVLLTACGGGGGASDVVVVPADPPPVVTPPADPLASLVVGAAQAGGPGNLDGQGSAARFSIMQLSAGIPASAGAFISAPAGGVAVDASGALYVADAGNGSVRRISTGGAVTTVATGLLLPYAVAVDGNGTLYVTETARHTIVRISATGQTSTVAGLAGSEGSADGTGTQARFSYPAGIAVDNTGTLYVADTGNVTIRRITPGGAVSTIAGAVGWANRGWVDGPAAQARFNTPHKLALDSAGNLFIAEADKVRRLSPAGVVSTVAVMNRTGGVAVAADGSVYASEILLNTIQKISPAGVVTTVAGLSGFTGSTADGAALDARFSAPSGLALDSTGHLYITELNNTVRKLDTQGRVSTLAGAPALPGLINGLWTAARFNGPEHVVVDAAGTAYVSDYSNNAIRRITREGVVSTLAPMNFPAGLLLDAQGNLRVVEGWGTDLRTVTPAGTTGNVLASGGIKGSTLSGSNKLVSRGSVATNGSGTFYISDPFYHVVRRIDPTGTASVFAGTVDSTRTAYAPGTNSADGMGTAARLNNPSGLAVDRSGNLYVADAGNNTIRRITPEGLVSTWAGAAGPAGDADGPRETARFSRPTGLVFDAAGNLYVSDRDNSLVRKISPTGLVTTVAGVRGQHGVRAGGLPATLNAPAGIAIGPQGELWVTDTTEHLVLRITP